MTFKIKKSMEYATLIGLMAINPINNFNNTQNESFSDFKKQEVVENDLEHRLWSEDVTLTSFGKQQDFLKQANLINKAIARNTHSSMDSVIKFVDKSSLNTYFSLNNLPLSYTKDAPVLNKLRVLMKDGDEVAKDRFQSSDNLYLSLDAFANKLCVNAGSYEYDKESSRNFFKIYKDDIEKSAKKYDISPELLGGLLAHESGGRSFTMSRTGALGAAQLTSYIYDPQHRWPDGEKEPINPFDTPTAIDRSANYLSNLVKRYERYDDSNHTLALTAYNQGDSVVNSALRISKINGISRARDVVNFSYTVNNNDTDTTNIHNVNDNSTNINKDNNSTDSTNIKYLLSDEGRSFSSKVQREMVKISPLFNEKYLASLN